MLEAIKFALGVMGMFALIAGLILLVAWTITFSAWFIVVWVFLLLVIFGFITEVQ